MKKENYPAIIVALTMVLLSHYSYSQKGCQTPEETINLAGERAFNDCVNKFKVAGGHLNTDLKIIPVVIHVIYRNIGDRLQITQPRIQGQIEATNKQLRRLNANANETRARFLPVVADCNIQVALATRNPDRIRFNGVIYHGYPDFNFRRDYPAVQAATILDPNKYLNVWIIPDTSAASAIFPWGKTAISDGFWIGSNIFGTMGSNLEPLQNEGTTFTHELAHCLGVLHTFDNGPEYLSQCIRAYDGSICDYCSDTPLDWTRPFGLPDECDNGVRTPCRASFPLGLIAQTENYMYYNPDKCLNMFSRDQRARMRACLHGYRSELTTLRNLLFTGVRWTDLRGNNSYSQVPEMPDEIIDNDLTPGKSLSKNDISIFPNPAKNNIHLTYRNPAIKSMSLKVYNQTGVKLRELHSNTAIYELNLEGLPDGVYYINMTIDNVPVTKRVIKTGAGRSVSAQ